MRLSFENYARNAYESQRPDLWPIWACIPRLGITGADLYDAAYGRYGTHNMSWQTFVGKHALYNNGSANIVGHYPNASEINTQWATGQSPFAFVFYFALDDWDNKAAIKKGLICTRLDSHQDNTSILISSFYGNHTIILQSYNKWSGTSNSVSIPGLMSPSGDKLLVQWDGTEMSVYRNGAYIGAKTVLGGFPTVARNDLYVGLGNDVSIRWFNGHIFSMTLHPRSLTHPEAVDITSDPLLPFRRRAVQPYWVLDDVPGGVFKPAWAQNRNILIAS